MRKKEGRGEMGKEVRSKRGREEKGGEDGEEGRVGCERQLQLLDPPAFLIV